MIANRPAQWRTVEPQNQHSGKIIELHMATRTVVSTAVRGQVQTVEAEMPKTVNGAAQWKTIELPSW
eukprot:9479848-Alexandrium_andersonii.AAC.1